MIQLRVYEDRTKVQQYWLDLYDSEPIKLTLSIEDITSADATSTYSKAFKVPGTRKNNEFFKQAFEINGVLFDVTVKKPAEILVDGAEFRHGHIRLNKMIKNTELDRYDYELVFLGETRDFSSIIGDRQMCALNLTDLTGGDSGAPLTRADIIQSWQAFPETAPLTAGLHDGNIIYPLIDHGNTYDDLGVPEQPEVRTGTLAGGKPFTSTSFPLDIDQMYPMIRAKRIWDQIFSDAGYTYSSSFIDSNRFHQMYLSAFDNVARPSYDAASSSEYNFSAQNTSSGGGFLGGGYQGFGIQSADEIVVDPSGSWDGQTYIVQATGEHTFTASAYFYGYTEIRSSWPPEQQTEYGNICLYVNGVSVACGSWAGYSTSILTHTLNLNAGDEVYFFMSCNESADFLSSTLQSFACIASPGNINPASLLECTYKQIDFIKDILLMFRLVLSPDPNNPRNFIVEPWQTYINSGQLYDWSKKLVEDKDVVIEPVFFSQSDNITFAQPTDGDYINIYHQLSYKHNWGWLQFDSGNELLKGNREIKITGIANTPMSQIEGEADTSTWILPQIHVHETDENKVRHLPIKTKTRLLFYNGLKATPIPWYMVNNAAINSYPLMSQYEAWPITQGSLNLAFSNDIQYWGTSVPGGYNLNGATLYDSYWSRYISSLYNKYSRRVTAYFVLNNIDLNTFSFDDTIFVNGVYYIPEKIIDVQIGAYTEVQVQLLTANDYVPVWNNETLFATATGQNLDCYGQPGSILVETGGAGPINWTISNGLSGQFDNGAPPPYTFTIDDVPVGTFTIDLTDAIGRTFSQSVTIPEGTPVTSSYVATNTLPGECDGQIVVTPVGTAPFYIFWSDQTFAGTFTRTGLCCGVYSYFVRDFNNCVTNQTIVNIECTGPTYTYEVREYNETCSTVGSTSIIAQSATPITIGNTNAYELDSIPGCFTVIAESTLQPIANIIETYTDCEQCQYYQGYFYNIGYHGEYPDFLGCTQGGGFNQNVSSLVPLAIGTTIKLKNIDPSVADILNESTCYWIRSESSPYVQAEVAIAYDTCIECDTPVTPTPTPTFIPPTPTPSTLECAEFELYGGITGRSFTFTRCGDTFKTTLTVPQGDSLGECIKLPYIAPGAIQGIACGPTACTEYTLYNGQQSDEILGYTLCDGAQIQTYIGGFESFGPICAETDSLVHGPNIFIIGEDPCGGPVTPTPTPVPPTPTPMPTLAECINYTIGGYDIGETTYLDCDGFEQTAYYNGPSASGYDATSFCATAIIIYYGAEPYPNGNSC